MIWVLSGTESGRELVSALLEAGTDILVTTGTGYRQDLYIRHPKLRYIPGKFEREDMPGLVKEHMVTLIIDATHPYSVDVTLNAMNASQETSARYIRYEKKPVQINGALKLKEYSEASSHLEKKKGNIMLLIGTDRINSFSRIPRERLFARIVPFLNSVEEALGSGIRPGNIVAMSFKMSREFNSLLYRELDIQFLVTKEPGDTGGIMEMIEAAVESGVEVLVVRRPEIHYPEVVHEINDILRMIG